ncbi:MAG: ATP synthase F1 subunit delta [Planctomycetota bacterium]|nr:ATP synthase F1 subunit delta [Planctomycetota bacterium]
MTSEFAVAARYARALAEALTDDATFARVAKQVRELADVVSGSKELRTALASPVVGVDAKGRAVAELATRAGADAGTLRFLKVLASRDRLALMPQVARAVEAELTKRSGVRAVELTTAHPLDAATKERIVAALETAARGKVEVEVKVDPDLLGGVVAKIGTTVFDASLRTRLAQLRSRLAG